jgi:hydrogenase maturation factor
MRPLPVGKLRAEALRGLLAGIAPRDPRVVVGPRVGEDAAVLDLGDRYLVATSDPITFATDAVAWYALQVNANDVAVRGARPRWFLATVLLPEGAATEQSVAALFAELGAACRELDVALVGGHTEVTAGLDRTVVVGTMLGEVDKAAVVTTGGAQVGDAVLLSKGVPLEGAAILASERGEDAVACGVEPAAVARARGLLRDPGISVVREALAACARAPVHAMHDPTEGGLATACWELAEAGDVGLRIERARVPLVPEGARLCAAFGLDPLGTIASGALLLTAAPAAAAEILDAWRSIGVAGAEIGRVTAAAEGVVLVEDGRARPMPRFEQDEITRLFARTT